MKAPRFFSLALAIFLLGLVFAGCTKSPFDADAPLTEENTSKMRNANLFGDSAKFVAQARVLERY